MKARMLAGLALALIVMEANAAPLVASCHGCSESQTRRMAEAQVPLSSRQSWFDVYVVNTPGRALRRYTVQVERSGGFPVAMAWPEAPDPVWQREFDAHADAWHAVMGLFKSAFQLPADAPVRSVTEVFYSAAEEDAVSALLNEDLAHFAGSLIASTLKLLPGVVWSARVYVTVRFADGTTGQFQLTDVELADPEMHVFKFRYVPGSARDGEGNAIPDRLESFYGFAADYQEPYNRMLFDRQVLIYSVRLMVAPDFQRKTVVCVKTEDEVVCWVRKHR